MSTDRDITRIVRSWLRTDEHESADRVLDAVLDRLDTTPQRRSTWWPARRFPYMNTAAKFGLAAAVVVVAALLGFNYLVAPNVGGLGLDDATPTQTPIPTPTATSFDEHPGGPVRDGTYYIDVAGHRVTFTVPTAGWTKNVVPGVVWTENSENRVGFGDIETVNADPCRPDLGPVTPPVGATADDLVAALSGLPGVEVTTADVTVSGFSGTLVELTAPASFGNCVESGGEALLGGDGPLEPGIHRFWVLDVDGTRIVINAVERPGSLDRQVTEMLEIANSVQID